jgi:hypothetical protein
VIEFLRDVKYASRNLTRKPAFSAVIIATLALGIGGNTAILIAAHAILFSPLPLSTQRGIGSHSRHHDWTERQP